MKKINIITFATLAVFLLISCKNNYIPEIKPKQETKQETKTTVPVSDIRVDSGESTISMVKGTESTINARTVPNNASDKKLTFSSDKPDIASITYKGVIKAEKPGNAVITIKAKNGVERTVNVTVTAEKVPVADIELPSDLPASLTIGDTYKLTAKAKPDTATEKGLTYTADNGNVQIAEDGTVTAVKEGTVNITVTSKSLPPVAKTIAISIKKKPEIKYEAQRAVMLESAAGEYSFTVQTIHGKLDYEPRFTSNRLPWITGAPAISSRNDSDKDVISFTCEKNKTVWDRRAYIKFWDRSVNSYVKGPDGKELTVNIIQKRNEHPVIHYKWIDGIGSPAENEKEKVGINNNGIPTGDTYPQSYVFKWKETANTKFYNVRKLDKLYVQGQFPNDYFVINGIYGKERQGKDLSQCWAKTASNMLHWWFEQNKDYIDQYKQKVSIEAWKLPLYDHKYERGLADVEENKKSNIANIFRAYTHNNSRGGYIEDGLTWYLYKRNAQKNLGSTIYPGLFNDVFTHDTSPITIERCETKKEFEQLMNKALDNKRAIGIFWQGRKGSRPYQHAVTCWGAAYDEENNIICLYIAESNLTEAVLYPFGVRYKGNIYAEAEKNRTYMFNYALSKPEDIYIDGLTTLDLGETQWKEWLNKH